MESNAMNRKKQFVIDLMREIAPHIVIALALFLFVVIIGRSESYTLSPAPQESTSTSLAVTTESDREIPYITDVRIVAEYGDSVGIFDTSYTLLEVFGLDLLRLTPTDRQLLKKGISFDSESEMRDFLESLDS